MRNLISLFLLVVLFVSAGAVTLDQSTPEKTIRSFVESVKDKDLASAVKCVKDGKYNKQIEQTDQMLKTEPFSVDLKSVKVSEKGSSASAQTSVVVVLSRQNFTINSEETVKLLKVGSSWYLVHPGSKPKGEDFINSFVVLSVDGQLQSETRTDNKKLVCISQLKQIALAIMIRASENKEVIKLNPKTWTKQLQPYTKSAKVFTCPLDPKGTISYTINPAVLGVSTMKFRKPAETVLIYEGKNKKLLFRHNGKAVIAYMDGHVGSVSKEDAKKLRWVP